MTDPRSWALQCKPSSSLDQFGGNPMAGLSAGLVAGADVNSQTNSNGGGSGSSPAQWATLWFGFAVIYLVGIYYGMITIRATA